MMIFAKGPSQIRGGPYLCEVQISFRVPLKPHHLIDRSLTNTPAQTCGPVLFILILQILIVVEVSAILALFLGSSISKRIDGDVAEWSKALPC